MEQSDLNLLPLWWVFIWTFLVVIREVLALKPPCTCLKCALYKVLSTDISSSKRAKVAEL